MKLLYEYLKNPPPPPRCQMCGVPLPSGLEDLQQVLDAGWHVWGASGAVFFCPGCVEVHE